MDDESEKRRLVFLLIAIIAFFFSGYYSLIESKYWLWGETASATVNRVYRTNEYSSRGRRRPKQAVEYTFTDKDGTSRSERDIVALSWPVKYGETVGVQYIPGAKHSSRLEGNSNGYSVLIFAVCVVSVTVGSVRLWRHAHWAVHGGKKRKRKKRAPRSELEWSDSSEEEGKR